MTEATSIKNSWMGAGLAIASAAGYAFLPIITRAAYERTDITPLQIVIWRFVIAVTVMWVLVWGRGQMKAVMGLTMRQVAISLGLGSLFTVAALSAFTGLDYVPATTFTVILYSYPALIALYSVALGDRLPGIKWIAIGLAFFGVALTAGGKPEGGSLLGMGLVFNDAVFYGLYLTLSARIASQIPGFIFGAISMTGSLLALVPVMIFKGLSAPDQVPAWLYVIALVIFGTILPILTLYKAMEYIGAPNAAIISTVEPVITVVFAAILLSEQVDPIQYVGGAFVFASVLLIQAPLLRRWRLRANRIPGNP